MCIRDRKSHLARCFGATSHRNLVELDKVCEQRQSAEGYRFESSVLGRIFNTLSKKCNPPELAVHSSVQYLHHRTVRSGIVKVLKTCTSLRILKFCDPVTGSIIKGLAAGLVGNHTLCHLQINKKGLTLRATKPLLTVLHLCSLSKLEFVDGLVFNKILKQNEWKVDMSNFCFSTVEPVSYTHLTLPTIYSV